MIAKLRDRNRAGAHPHLLRINLCQEDGHRGTGSSLVLIAVNRANHSLPLDTISMQILLRPAKLPDRRPLFATDSCQTSTLHCDPPAPPFGAAESSGIGRHYEASGELPSELLCGGNGLRPKTWALLPWSSSPWCYNSLRCPSLRLLTDRRRQSHGHPDFSARPGRVLSDFPKDRPVRFLILLAHWRCHCGSAIEPCGAEWLPPRGRPTLMMMRFQPPGSGFRPSRIGFAALSSVDWFRHSLCIPVLFEWVTREAQEQNLVSDEQLSPITE